MKYIQIGSSIVLLILVIIVNNKALAHNISIVDKGGYCQLIKLDSTCALDCYNPAGGESLLRVDYKECNSN